MIFWITAICLSLAVAVMLALALLRGRQEEEHPAAYDLRVYRDQLREVDRDLARGVIGAEDAERVRAEVGRRVLAADAQVQASGQGTDQPRGATWALTALAALAVLGGAIGLYQVLGQPGARDLPLAQRIALSDAARQMRDSQAEHEAKLPATPLHDPENEQFAALVAKLREAVANNPDDLQGQQLLARNEAVLGNLRAAYAAQKAVIRIKGEAATAQDHVALADMMISAARGYVSPEAEAALRAALTLDQRNPVARYYTGLMMLQNDRPDVTFRLWDGLLKESPADAPWVAPIRSEIVGIAAAAGVRYQLPPQAAGPAQQPGPTAEDIANAAEMSAEDRDAMVRSMVERLNDRLAAEGGPPADWARLLSALGVLGETDRARAIWDEAQQVFDGKPAMLATVRQGAVRAGVADAGEDSGANDGANTNPAPLPGPTQEDVENASEMNPQDRQEMIRNMVSQLAGRLASDGGSAEEWARLINAQAVLGDKDAAARALSDARAALAGNDAGLTTVETAARRAGVIE